MKKLFVILICFIFMGSIAFSLTPPTAVKKAFAQKFPNATKVKWGKENKTEFEAEFTLNGTKISANFAQNGDWVETEAQIKVSELPKAVTDAINKQYPGWKIIKAEKTDNAKEGTIYEAGIMSGKHKKGVEFKADGTPVKG
jgi:hypothetical protein